MTRRTLFCFVVLTLLLPTANHAQEEILDVPFETIPGDLRVVSSHIELQGDVLATGEVESTVGYRFPDGTFQATAVAGGQASSVCESLTANAGEYSNRIVDFVPPLSYIEVCFKNGGVFSDIHTVSESPTGGVCAPGDTGWIIERLERVAATWTLARAECLKHGMRLPEPFEWQYSCEDAINLGISGMTDDWEWTSNEARFFHPEVTKGIGTAIMGNSSCRRGSWTWVGRGDTASAGAVAYRCAR